MSTLAEGGMRVILCSTDPRAEAKEIADELGCDSAYGMTAEQAEILGTGWQETRISNEGHAPYGEIKAHAQPTAFLLARNGKILSSSYSSGPSFGIVKGEDVARRLNWLLTYPKAWRPNFGLAVDAAE